MAAAAILDIFEWAISPQRLTIYLYSAHRAVIFAIAQLSCIDRTRCTVTIVRYKMYFVYGCRLRRSAFVFVLTL